MPRLFIAVWPPHDVVAVVAALHRDDRPGVRFVPPENWHITLRFLGDANITEVIDALRHCTLTSTQAHLGPAVDVIAGRALVVPVEGLDSVAAQVARCTSHLGEPPRQRFRGHLTLARLKSHVPTPDVVGAPVTCDFDVGQISLVESHLGPHGARYETIKSWTLH
jgi:2'-5' RNA ligase